MKHYYFNSSKQCLVVAANPLVLTDDYIEIEESFSGIFKDTYKLPDGRRIDFAYTKEGSWQTDYVHWHNSLKAHLEKHGVGQAINCLILIRRSYPKEEFETILKEYR